MSLIGSPKKPFSVVAYNRQKADAAARLKAATPKITCSWCGTSVEPNAPRMRVHQSESSKQITKCLATLHPECGDALLDYCERRVARKARKTPL